MRAEPMVAAKYRLQALEAPVGELYVAIPRAALEALQKPLSRVWEAMGEDPASTKATIEADLVWIKDMRDRGLLPPAAPQVQVPPDQGTAAAAANS